MPSVYRDREFTIGTMRFCIVRRGDQYVVRRYLHRADVDIWYFQDQWVISTPFDEKAFCQWFDERVARGITAERVMRSMIAAITQLR